MYVCICYAVTETELAGVLAAGARSEEEVGDACGAGTGCGSCLDRICDGSARSTRCTASGSHLRGLTRQNRR